MFYTYIITNKQNGTLYTGHTDDLSERMEKHIHTYHSGFAAKYGCNILVWFEIHETRDDAFRRERQIKKWKRAWKINLIEKENPYWLDIHAQPTWPSVNGHRPTPPPHGKGANT